MASSDQLATRRWLGRLAILLVVTGIGLSGYLTYAHYTTATVLACPETGIVNCAKVTSSIYATIFGVPLALLGLLYFLFMVPLQWPTAWLSNNRWLRRIRLVASGSGLVMVFWLLYVELFKLNAICLYCTAVHIVTVLLFGLTVVGTALTPRPPEASA